MHPPRSALATHTPMDLSSGISRSDGRLGNGNGGKRQDRWGIFEERKSWLASLKFSSERDGLVSTTKTHWLWQNFHHLFEAPRRRTLTSSDSSPSMLKFCMMCTLWYSTSAMSSNTGKAILNRFRYPVTLTFVQFGFVAAYCLLFMSPIIRFTRLRKATRTILKSTFPMGVFQVGGHMFSSMAISRIPVSTVHTIKALSPLFTVLAYAMLFGVKYSPKTYLSLLPLTLGVMLACSFDVSASNALGLICAFASAIVFVSSNIFFKKVMPSNSSAGPHTATHRLDKLNLLFYSSGMAFLLMIPMWLYYDLPVFLSTSNRVTHPSHGHESPHGVVYYFFINGTVHFGQNIIAFIILSSTSPVTYSIASLFKRVAVICIAILWFNQAVHPVQGMGICLTFAGLWMYNNTKADVEKGENKMRRVEAARELILPSTRAEHRMMHSDDSPALSENETDPVSISSAVEYNSPAFPQEQAHPVPVLPPSRPLPSRHNPNLTIKITPTAKQTKAAESPIDSYPSPPPSNDSPPHSAAALPTAPEGKSRRRGTVSRTHAHVGSEAGTPRTVALH